MGLFNNLFGKKTKNQEQNVPKQAQEGNGDLFIPGTSWIRNIWTGGKATNPTNPP